MNVTTARPLGSDKLLSLESLRGLAALSVALFHFDVGSHLNSTLTARAWMMVDLFFVLSGFVIALTYRDKILRLPDLAVFQWKRFKRLYPLHVTMLLIFLGIEVLKWVVGHLNIAQANNPPFSSNDLGSFVQNLLLIQAWVSPQMTWNFPSWSISAEFYTYLIFGIFFLIAKRSLGLLLPLLAVTIIASGLALAGQFGTDINLFPFRCLYAFGIGVVGQILFARYALAGTLRTSTTAAVMLIATVLLVTLGTTAFGSPAFPAIPLVFCALILSLAATCEDAVVIRIASLRPLVHLGTISYGVYMIHAAVWWVYRQVAIMVLHAPSSVNGEGMVTIKFESPLTADAFTLSGLALTVLLAHLSYTYLETRFYRSSRSARPKPVLGAERPAS
ncbi:acyltransferase family protein [Roseibium aestuarii]|uniref:Acyltransferase family protein n=1 Tax=Roseibium aestuarii TaxID=2600299 RepID=A0ABW4JWU6_9HYPH|nr:acyltransferase [Roseibium aestuarii]